MHQHDSLEHERWSDRDARWSVPEPGAPVPPSHLAPSHLVAPAPAAPPPAAGDATAPGPARGRRGPGPAVLVLVGALVAFVLALGFGTIQSRRSGPTPSAAGTRTETTTGPGTTALTPSSADPVVDKVDDAVVNITTTIGYRNGSAAGTGMILTSSGQILTNNHVIEGATRITATVSTTGRSYPATVVGTSPREDIAVLQLQGASNLRTISISTATVQIGDLVVAMGNAGGDGGAPEVATGQVIALDRTITATDEGGGNARRLTDLIQVSAPLESGDSGGPLANSAGEVIGINTAASVEGGRYRSTSTSGYAIPITKAVSIVRQIESGVESDTVTIGLPAFLGVQLAPASASPAGSGALVAGVEPGTPAASAGIAAGDTIVSVDGTTVGSAAALSNALRQRDPGDRVTVGWTTSSGTSRSARVSLTTGPAD